MQPVMEKAPRYQCHLWILLNFWLKMQQSEGLCKLVSISTAMTYESELKFDIWPYGVWMVRLLWLTLESAGVLRLALEQRFINLEFTMTMSKYSAAEAIVGGCFAQWLTRMNDILSACFGYFSAGLFQSQQSSLELSITLYTILALGDVKEEINSLK